MKSKSVVALIITCTFVLMHGANGHKKDHKEREDKCLKEANISSIKDLKNLEENGDVEQSGCFHRCMMNHHNEIVDNKFVKSEILKHMGKGIKDGKDEEFQKCIDKIDETAEATCKAVGELHKCVRPLREHPHERHDKCLKEANISSMEDLKELEKKQNTDEAGCFHRCMMRGNKEIIENRFVKAEILNNLGKRIKKDQKEEFQKCVDEIDESVDVTCKAAGEFFNCVKPLMDHHHKKGKHGPSKEDE